MTNFTWHDEAANMTIRQQRIIKTMTKRPELTLDSILKFGKYSGQQVADLIEDDPQYLKYMTEEEAISLDEEAQAMLDMK